MLSEIYARGPIACTIAVTQAFEEYTGGVFNDSTGAKVSIINGSISDCLSLQALDHEISVAGWGVTSAGVKYWIGRNSCKIIIMIITMMRCCIGGTYWGEGGWFRIIRGTNNLGIEANCDWAVPNINF